MHDGTWSPSDAGWARRSRVCKLGIAWNASMFAEDSLGHDWILPGFIPGSRMES